MSLRRLCPSGNRNIEGTDMRGIQLIRNTCKRLPLRIVALVCAVCFVTAFILFSTLHLGHAGHEDVAGCPLTFESVCKCEIESSQAPISECPTILDYSQTQPYSHGSNENLCLSCAHIVRTVDQLKHLIIASNTISFAEASVFALAALCLLTLFFGITTPTGLKVKMSN